MSKFKIGDRVRYTGASDRFSDSRIIGAVGTVIDGNNCNDVQVNWDMESMNGASTRGGKYEENLELVTPSSPVREVTRKEIVPGVYGTVRVGFRGETYVNIRMERDYHTAPELRAAAATLIELADALEDK